jgi:hypothetical protein
MTDDEKDQEIERLSVFESRYQEEYDIVKRIWELLGFDEYNSKGDPTKSIYEYIEDLKGERERLKAALEAIDDHGRALSFVETLKEKDAELVWHKQEVEAKDIAITLFKNLIAELADALDGWTKGKHGPTAQKQRELSKRARAAVSSSNREASKDPNVS